MSCVITTKNLCFRYRETLPEVIVPFEDISVWSGFGAEVYINNRKYFDLPDPTVVGNRVFFNIEKLKERPAGNVFSVYIYGDVNVNGRTTHQEIVLLKIKLCDGDCCDTPDDELQPFTVNVDGVEIPVSLQLAIMNIGDGATVDLKPYIKTADADLKYQPKGDYATRSEIPIVPSLADYQKTVDADQKYQLKGDYATNTALNTVKSTVDANAANIAANSQQVSLNTQNVQAMQTALNYKADKAYVDNNFLTTTTANSNYALKSHTHSYNDLTDKPTIPSLAGYATESWANGQFQPKGSYLTTVSWADVTGKPTTFAPSAHGHNASDISGLVDYSKQYQIIGNLGLSDSLNNTLLIGKSTANVVVPTGLASGFVCEVYASVGDITVSGASGVSFEANGGKFIIKQGKSAVLIQIGNSNSFILKGELS